MVRASPSHAPPRFPGRHVMMHASHRVEVLFKDLWCVLHHVHIDSPLLPAVSRCGSRWSIHRRHLGSASFEAPPARFVVPPVMSELTVPGMLSPAAGVMRCRRYVVGLPRQYIVASRQYMRSPRRHRLSTHATSSNRCRRIRRSYLLKSACVRKPQGQTLLHRSGERLTFSC